MGGAAPAAYESCWARHQTHAAAVTQAAVAMVPVPLPARPQENCKTDMFKFHQIVGKPEAFGSIDLRKLEANEFPS